MNLNPQIVESHSRLASWRRDIHAHPELAFNEHRTAQLVTDRLRAAGIEVFTGIGGTGVVGRLKGGRGSRSIGLRADLDALPMQENNNFEHKSGVDGVFHGCGHDGHTIMLLGAALQLARQKNFDGTVHFIFQPAEEGMGGAEAMIRDGLFETFPMDLVFGMHNWPGMPVGYIGVRPGPMMAAFEKFDIDIQGVGGHGAMPHLCVDPIPVAAQMIQALQTVVSRNVNPMKSAVMSITQVHTGDAYNVIPESVRLSGAIRFLDKDVGDEVMTRMNTIVTATARAAGATAELTFLPLGYPALVNEPNATEIAIQAAKQVVGVDQVDGAIEPVLASEDFASMLEQRPGCYVFIGNGVDSEGGCMVHHPEYDFNDEVIPVGASYWAALTQDYLAPES
jgi:hippurate hydrolase